MTARWRLVVDKPLALHLVLFLRDACHLTIPVASDIPPQLNGKLPELPDLFDKDTRLEAELLWPDWWRVTLEYSIREVMDTSPIGAVSPQTGMGRARDGYVSDLIAATTDGVGEFTLAILDAGRKWIGSSLSKLQIGPANPFDLELLSGVFGESFARRNSSAPSTVGLIELDVAGDWSYIHNSGVILCSTAETVNQDHLRVLLLEAVRISTGHPEPVRPLPFDLQNIEKVNSTSILDSPILLVPIDEGHLILQDVRTGGSGLELHFELIDSNGQKIVSPSLDLGNWWEKGLRRVDPYDGLELDIFFPDGRFSGVIESPNYSQERDVVAHRFSRPPKDPYDLWLFVMPYPTLPQFSIELSWAIKGISKSRFPINLSAI